MNHTPDDKPSLPIACTFTAAEIESVRESLLPTLLSQPTAKERVSGGFRWRFDQEPDLVKKVAAVIDFEHRCCQFLRFVLSVEPGDGPLWLEVTGPEGTEDFLSHLLTTGGPRS